MQLIEALKFIAIQGLALTVAFMSIGCQRNSEPAQAVPPVQPNAQVQDVSIQSLSISFPQREDPDVVDIRKLPPGYYVLSEIVTNSQDSRGNLTALRVMLNTPGESEGHFRLFRGSQWHAQGGQEIVQEFWLPMRFRAHNQRVHFQKEVFHTQRLNDRGESFVQFYPTGDQSRVELHKIFIQPDLRQTKFYRKRIKKYLVTGTARLGQGQAEVFVKLNSPEEHLTVQLIYLNVPPRADFTTNDNPGFRHR